VRKLDEYRKAFDECHRNFAATRWAALSLKRKILLVLITWGIIEEVVSWIFKAHGIDVGPLGVFSLMGTFISGF